MPVPKGENIVPLLILLSVDTSTMNEEAVLLKLKEKLALSPFKSAAKLLKVSLPV